MGEIQKSAICKSWGLGSGGHGTDQGQRAQGTLEIRDKRLRTQHMERHKTSDRETQRHREYRDGGEEVIRYMTGVRTRDMEI